MRENARTDRPDRRIIVYLVAVIVCVFLGPFGTREELVFWDRLVFWTLTVSSVGVFMEVCIRTALRSPILKHAHFSIRLAIGSVIGGLPGASMVSFVNQVMRPEHLATSPFPLLWAEVSFLTMIIAGLDLLTQPREEREFLISNGDTPEEEKPAAMTTESPQTQSSAKTSRLLERLSPSLRMSRVLSLSMQDHYVEVTTTKGCEMVLMRLSDAIDLLDAQEGVQTHRSHWVASDAIGKLIRDGRKHNLKLKDGRSIPVSKSYLAAVEDVIAKKERQA